MFTNALRKKVAKLEEENAVLQAYVEQLDRQTASLQASVEALAVTNQQMINDMKLIYGSLESIVNKTGENPVDKFFVSIINNNEGGNLPH